jgi:HTH-type transcriptional regulator/antitoxin HipB
MQISRHHPAATRIAQAVRRERIRQGLTQAELALAAGVSVRVIHQIEARKPSTQLDSIDRVLRALGLSLTVDGRTETPGAEGPQRQRVRRL